MKTTRQIKEELKNPTAEVLELELQYSHAMRETRSTPHNIIRMIEDVLGIETWTPAVLDTLNALMLSGKI